MEKKVAFSVDAEKSAQKSMLWWCW